jgi:hypothetical protein
VANPKGLYYKWSTDTHTQNMLYGTTRQAADGNIIWRMGIAWWVPKATDTHTEYVIFVFFSTQKNSFKTRLNIRLHVQITELIVGN